MSHPRSPFVVILLVALVGLGAGGRAGPEKTETYQAIGLYAEAMSLIHERYVDELPWSKLAHDGISGAIRGLDSDSALLDPAQYRRLTGAPPAGEGDIGVDLTRRGGGLTVVAVRDGMPAQRGGLRSGDRILKIADADTLNMPPADAADRLRGRPGSQVTLSLLRQGWAEPQPVSLIRAVPAASVVTDRGLGDGVLSLRVPVVDDAAATRLRQLLASTSPPRAAGVVLDLRNTAGGSVKAATAIAGLFLAPGCVVARVESRIPGQAGDLLSASAGEVLAAALQDSGRAVVVGSATFGDATAQSVIPLPGNFALSLTTARYLTPEHHVITGRGIAPDVAVATPRPTTLQTAATEAGAKDPQMEMAFEVVKAAHIHGHGTTPGDSPVRVESAVGRCPAHAG
jgi:carboxyl-terminal processing protease